MRRRNYPTSIVSPSSDSPSQQQQQNSIEEDEVTRKIIDETRETIPPTSSSSSSNIKNVNSPTTASELFQPPQQKLMFAESILQDAGGCPILRRFVFQYLDRYEALRLSDVCPSWRLASSHPASWLPLFLSSARSGSGGSSSASTLTRSITISANENYFSSSNNNSNQQQQQPSRTTSPRALLSPGDAGLNFAAISNSEGNNQSYLPPTTIPDYYSSSTNPNLNSTSSMFASYSKQIVARAAFPSELTSALFGKSNYNNSNSADAGGVNNVFAAFSDAETQSNFLEKLWDLKTPEIYFAVSEVLRKPSRELAAVLEYCEKLLSLVHQARYSNLNLHSAVMAVQTQLFVALELLAHPVAPPPPPPNPLTGNKQSYKTSVYGQTPEKKRFMNFFPSAIILLRCPLLLRVAALDYKVPASLHHALNKNEFLKEDVEAKARSMTMQFSRNLSPVVVLFTEMLRWHQADAARENAAWFCTMCLWTNTIPQLFSSPSVISSTSGNQNNNANSMTFHPIYVLPHLLALRSLCLSFPSVSETNSNNNDSFGGANTPLGNNSFSSNSPAASTNNNNNGNTDVASTTSNNINSTNSTMEAEECKDNFALRQQMKKHFDAESIVKLVVRSCVELTLRLWNIYHKKGSESILMEPQQQHQQSETKSRVAASDVALCFDTLAKLEYIIRNDVIWHCSTGETAATPSSTKSKNEEKELNIATQRKYVNLVREEVASYFSEHDGTGDCGVSLLDSARNNVEKKFGANSTTGGNNANDDEL